MPLLDALQTFGSRVLSLIGLRKTIAGISESELREQRVLLDRQEDDLLGRLNGLEKDKTKLFDEAKAEKDPRRQERAAARIAGMVRDISLLDAELGRVRKELRLVTGLEFIKRRSARATTPQSKLVSSLTVGEMASLIDKATVNDQLNQEKLDDLLATMDGGLETTTATGAPDSLEQDILAQIRAAQPDTAQKDKMPAARPKDKSKDKEPGQND